MTEVWNPPCKLSLAHDFSMQWAEREATMREKWSRLYQKTEHAEIAFLSTKFLCVVEWTGDETGGWIPDLSQVID